MSKGKAKAKAKGVGGGKDHAEKNEKNERKIEDKCVLNNVPVFLAQSATELTEGLSYMYQAQGGFNSRDGRIIGLKIGSKDSGEVEADGNDENEGEEGADDYDEDRNEVYADDETASDSGTVAQNNGETPAANEQSSNEGSNTEWEMISGRTILTFLADDKTSAGTFRTRFEHAQKTIADKTPIGVVVECTHPSIRQLMGEFNWRNEIFALMGAYVLVDCWVETREKGGRPWLLARLYKATNDDLWWQTPDHRSQELHPAIQDHGKCPDCPASLQLRYEGLPAFCCRPGCESSKSPFDHPSETGGWARAYISAAETVDSRIEFQMLPDPPQQVTIDLLRENLEKRYRKRDGFSARKKLTDANRLSSRPAWNSYVCMKCFRFNRRVHWNRLECRCCKNVLEFRLPDMSFEDLVDEQWLDVRSTQDIIKECHWLPHAVEDPTDVDLSTTGTGSIDLTSLYLGVCFNLHDNNSVYVLVPRKQRVDNPADDGPRAWFEALWNLAQGGSIPLQRRRLKNPRVAGQLTAQFSKNYGEAYNTKLQTDDTPFEEEADLLQEIMGHVEQVISKAIGEDIVFNEHLPLGNYTNQRMGWHADGEDDIKGNAIASISLGGSAVMTFGLHPRYGHGNPSKKGVYAPIVRGTMEEAAKMDLYKQRGTLTDDEFWRRYRDILAKCRPYNINQSKPVLQFPIPGTGAIVIQKGKTLNKIYVHQVEANGLARLVITGRVMMTEAEKAQRKLDKIAQKKLDDKEKRKKAKEAKQAAKGDANKAAATGRKGPQKRFAQDFEPYDPTPQEDKPKPKPKGKVKGKVKGKGKGKAEANVNEDNDNDEDEDDNDDEEKDNKPAPKKRATKRKRAPKDGADAPVKKRKDNDEDDNAGTGASTTAVTKTRTKKQASLPARTKAKPAAKTTTKTKTKTQKTAKTTAVKSAGGNARPQRQRTQPVFYGGMS